MGKKPRLVARDGMLVGGGEPPRPNSGIVDAKFLEFKVEPNGVYIRPSGKKGTRSYQAGIYTLAQLCAELERNYLSYRVLEDSIHGTGSLQPYIETVVIEPSKKPPT